MHGKHGDKLYGISIDAGLPLRREGEPASALNLSGVPKRLLVNGEPREIDVATLEQVLRVLDFDGATVATALNGAFVPARARDATPVKDGDRIEILAPRQGG
jgi:sulfur carrier protein